MRFAERSLAANFKLIIDPGSYVVKDTYNYMNYVNVQKYNGKLCYKLTFKTSQAVKNQGIDSGYNTTVNFFSGKRNIMAAKYSINKLIPNRAVQQKNISVYVPTSLLGTDTGPQRQLSLSFTFKSFGNVQTAQMYTTFPTTVYTKYPQ
jgi:hypothetical protein